jgi:hypothetical protein
MTSRDLSLDCKERYPSLRYILEIDNNDPLPQRKKRRP